MLTTVIILKSTDCIWKHIQEPIQGSKDHTISSYCRSQSYKSILKHYISAAVKGTKSQIKVEEKDAYDSFDKLKNYPKDNVSLVLKNFTSIGIIQ